MILYANGCSMTYGAELREDPATHMCLDDAYREKHSWPGVLGELLGADRVVNDAISGGSNDRILRTTMQSVSRLLREHPADEILVAVAWSSPNRREFCSNRILHEGHGDPWIQMLHNWTNTAFPSHAELHRIYFRHFWNDLEDAARFVTQVVSLQSYLACSGVRYVFCKAMEVPHPVAIKEAGCTDLARQVDPDRFLGWGDQHLQMHCYCKHTLGVKLGPRQHPLEEGHVAWAREIKAFVEGRSI